MVALTSTANFSVGAVLPLLMVMEEWARELQKQGHS